MTLILENQSLEIQPSMINFQTDLKRSTGKWGIRLYQNQLKRNKSRSKTTWVSKESNGWVLEEVWNQNQLTICESLIKPIWQVIKIDLKTFEEKRKCLKWMSNEKSKLWESKAVQLTMQVRSMTCWLTQ